MPASKVQDGVDEPSNALQRMRRIKISDMTPEQFAFYTALEQALDRNHPADASDKETSP